MHEEKNSRVLGITAALGLITPGLQGWKAKFAKAETFVPLRPYSSHRLDMSSLCLGNDRHRTRFLLSFNWVSEEVLD